MKRGVAISLIGHGAVLIWALVTFARPLEKLDGEAFPVDVLTTDEFSRIAQGDPKAPKAEKPKPIVDKIAEPTPPVEDPNAQVDKKTVTAATDQTNPEPAPPTPETKEAAAPPEAKVETKTPEKKEPEKKIDPIAEALKKDEAKKPEKKVETKPQPVKKPEPQQRKFDPRQIQANLDKRKPTRVASAGSEINNTASLGAPRGSAPVLTANEIDAIRRRLANNWFLNGTDNKGIVVGIFIRLRIDGSLDGEPEITTHGSGPQYEAVKISARNAVYRSAPFNFLSPSRYENWKQLDLSFTPEDLR